MKPVSSLIENKWWLHERNIFQELYCDRCANTSYVSSIDKSIKKPLLMFTEQKNEPRKLDSIRVVSYVACTI